MSFNPCSRSSMIHKIHPFAFLCCLFVGLPVSSAFAQSEAAPSGPYFGEGPPGEVPVLFAPHFFDFSGGYHSSVVFSPDGHTAYWTRMSMDTWVSSMERDRWTLRRQVNFGMVEDISEVHISPDGDRVYFLSSQGTASDPEERERIWRVERSGDGWSRPFPIQDEVSAHPTHWNFSVALNKNLYFTSQIAGVGGRGDIYVARFDGTEYDDPEPLGPEINSTADEICPFISPDESFLLFSRSGSDASNLDLFVSFRENDGTWSEAVSLGGAVNSDRAEISPVVSPDGEYLFFNSGRSRKMLIYWVDIAVIDRLRDRENRPTHAETG